MNKILDNDIILEDIEELGLDGMSIDNAKDNINYGELIDEAMHVIVKKALEVARDRAKLGDHHFFISFLTQYPGVEISEKLKRKYPHEMTIVLQYQYEDLRVEDSNFNVILSFDNVKERIIVPFSSLTAFADPSVKFGLQFRHIDLEHEIKEERAKIEESMMTDNKKKAVGGTKLNISGTSDQKVVDLKSFRNKKKKEKKE